LLCGLRAVEGADAIPAWWRRAWNSGPINSPPWSWAQTSGLGYLESQTSLNLRATFSLVLHLIINRGAQNVACVCLRLRGGAWGCLGWDQRGPSGPVQCHVTSCSHCAYDGLLVFLLVFFFTTEYGYKVALQWCSVGVVGSWGVQILASILIL